MASVFSSARAATASFDRLVVFGDSLSDAGNAGRFSNGPVWVEHLARAIGAEAAPARLGGTNFAVGGARTNGGAFSLRDQADLFLSRVAGDGAGNRALFVVYGGANDLRGALHAPDRQAVVERAVDTLRAILQDLIAAGADELLVPNLPDIGRTPEARAIGPDWARAARSLTLAFNERLATLLDELAARGPARIHRLDVFGLAERAAQEPGRFGFRNMTDPCPYGASAPERCDEYVFWDSMHPTTAGHARLADAALAALAGESAPP